MGKTVSIDTYRIHKQHTGLLDYGETAEIRERYEIVAAIIDELFVQAEECILECGFNPADFSIIYEFADDLLGADLIEVFDKGTETLILAYKTSIDGVEYSVNSSARVDGDNVCYDTEFIRFDDRGWFLYKDGSWVLAPIFGSVQE